MDARQTFCRRLVVGKKRENSERSLNGFVYCYLTKDVLFLGILVSCQFLLSIPQVWLFQASNAMKILIHL
jgi:hypothetical protein